MSSRLKGGLQNQQRVLSNKKQEEIRSYAATREISVIAFKRHLRLSTCCSLSSPFNQSNLQNLHLISWVSPKVTSREMQA